MYIYLFKKGNGRPTVLLKKDVWKIRHYRSIYRLLKNIRYARNNFELWLCDQKETQQKRGTKKQLAKTWFFIKGEGGCKALLNLIKNVAISPAQPY